MYLDNFSKAMYFVIIAVFIIGGLIGAGIYWLFRLFL